MTLPKPRGNSKYVLRLYVAGSETSSIIAIVNLEAVCREYLADCSELEIIDVLKNPGAAREANILVTPTLIKLNPKPLRRIFGDLSDKSRLLAALGIAPREPHD